MSNSNISPVNEISYSSATAEPEPEPEPEPELERGNGCAPGDALISKVYESDSDLSFADFFSWGKGGPSLIARKRQGFITKTYEVVDDPSVDDLISWNHDGSSFIIWKPPEFARELLVKHFNYYKFSIFIDQLDDYGFRKVDSDRWEFANDRFKRGKRWLLLELIQCAKNLMEMDSLRLSTRKPKRKLRSRNLMKLQVAAIDFNIYQDAISYCDLFPCHYEFQEETLIQLWLADGLFVREPMELIAGQFFDLIKYSFPLKRTDLMTGNTFYKPYCPSIKSRESSAVRIDAKSKTHLCSNVSHVSIMCNDFKDSSSILNVLKRFEHLRMLILLQGKKSSFNQLPRDFFLSLKLLRLLDLSQTHLTELPSSIGNMKCLRYLDLSDTPIKCLPEALCRLEMLQTLKLKGCYNISSLPKGMRKLVNLRHLDIDVLGQLNSMPQGMGAFTMLQTISAFLVGEEEGCNIGQLMNMNNISGSFCISRLENVLTDDEAKDACLSSKSKLKTLELRWGKSQSDGEAHTKVLSSLRPNESLVELCINGYGGSKLPTWMCSPTFSMLTSITIFDCENCSILPSSLGELPSLRFLNLINFPKLKTIDHSFFSTQKGLHPYPMLVKLTIEDMISLEQFTGTGELDFCHLCTLTVKHCPELHHIYISSFCLQHLEISHCARLESWADGKLPRSLKTLIIEDCPIISTNFLNDGIHDWQDVAHIPKVWIDHKEISVRE